MRVIEPAGLLHGQVARDAIAAGLGLPLAGGRTAFTLCAVQDAAGRRLIAVPAMPPAFAIELARLSAPAPLAGLPAGPLVMGILNVTPDSFSDGGRHLDAGAAIVAGLRMAGQGASLVDIGGESTRPGARPVSPWEEQDRILPVVAALVASGVSVSVDTRNAATMRAALAAGASLINDVSALAHDPDAAATLAASSAPVALMHMRGTPATMSDLAVYDDVAVAVVCELEARIRIAETAGIARDRLLIDPGIGFAKTTQHNLELLSRLPILANLGCRPMLGVSRKRFIGEVGGGPPEARDPGTLAALLPALAFPDPILRVHDVAGAVQAVRVWQAIHG